MPTRSSPSTMTADRPPLHPAAYHGIAGKVVRAIEPQTEADPVALLLTLLAALGSIIGAGPHWEVSGSRHSLRIWFILVGATSRGRKGTAWSAIKALLQYVAPDWLEACVASGLASGEGLIWNVRDPSTRKEPVREAGRIVSYQEVLSDEGVEDKRLFVIEEEFAAPLQVMKREQNILSPVIRQAWDSGDLRSLAKNSPARATGAHITITGHITQHELLERLDSTDAGNGFANRFMLVPVGRSKLLPLGGRLDATLLEPLALRLRDVIATAQTLGRIERSPETDKLWIIVYEALSQEEPGLLGAITSRSEAYVMRLAALYAVLDGTDRIQPVHLRAAVALWDYVEASVRDIFGDALGDPIADAILQELRSSGEMTRTAIRDLFQRNVKATRIQAALDQLEASGSAVVRSQPSAGKPIELWRPVEPTFGRQGRQGRASGSSASGILGLILPQDDPVHTTVDDDGSGLPPGSPSNRQTEGCP